MNTKYRVFIGRLSGGVYVFTPYGGVHSIHDTWDEAMTAVNRAICLDRLRDQKHRELFTPFERLGGAYAQTLNLYQSAFADFLRGFHNTRTQNDYALTN